MQYLHSNALLATGSILILEMASFVHIDQKSCDSDKRQAESKQLAIRPRLVLEKKATKRDKQRLLAVYLCGETGTTYQGTTGTSP